MKKSLNMTEGKILPLLIRFSLPLLIGNLFQQLYNMVDTWVVGNFVSNEAFSAVGTVGPIINMLIGFFMGLSNGVGVLVAQYFGAREEKEVQEVVHTAITMTVGMSLLVGVAGVLLTPLMTTLMQIPKEVLPEARLYLTIYFAGVFGLLFYNMGASILQAIGDSQHPFYYLTTAAILNVVLDLVFVLVFGMGVEGVALATVFSQFVSATLTIITLFRTDTCVRIRLRKLRIHLVKLKHIFRLGIPAAIQMMIISFSNIFVQAYINYFGADMMSGWTAYSKIDALMFMPVQAVSLATATFVGQNIGTGNVARAKQGVKIALILAFVITIIPMFPVMIFAPQLVAFFNAKAEVIEYGTVILHWMTPFYVLTCSTNIHTSALRGAGNTRTPMFVTIFSYVIFRQIYLFLMRHLFADQMIPIIMGYPAGWMVCALILIIYYHRTDLSSSSIHRVGMHSAKTTFKG